MLALLLAPVLLAQAPDPGPASSTESAPPPAAASTGMEPAPAPPSETPASSPAASDPAPVPANAEAPAQAPSPMPGPELPPPPKKESKDHWSGLLVSGVGGALMVIGAVLGGVAGTFTFVDVPFPGGSTERQGFATGALVGAIFSGLVGTLLLAVGIILVGYSFT